MATEKPWTEASISRALAYQLTASHSVLVVPNCGWTGHECDLLVVNPDLRITDIEVKISRADLLADPKKDKWYHHRPWSRRNGPGAREKREWPDKVWKHYYALPEAIWKPELAEKLPSNSGIILLCHDSRMVRSAGVSINVIRKAKPNTDAKPISPADAIDLARLTSLRLWNSLAKPENTNHPSNAALTEQL